LEPERDKIGLNLLVVIVCRGALRRAAPIAVLILIGVLKEGHSALAAGEHRACADVKDAASARATTNLAWREHASQQTATYFYRDC
jgi:hypothetical protein